MAKSSNGASQRGRHSQWLQVRIDADLDRLLDAAVKRLRKQGVRANRSSVTREVLRAGLADEGALKLATGTLKEIERTAERVVRQILGDAVKGMSDQIPDYVERELHQST